MFALSIALMPGLSRAAPSTDVSVAGRIKPLTATCTVTAPSTVQYGVVPLGKINPGGVTLLEKGNENFFKVLVDCSEPTKFFMRFVDNRRGTAVTDEGFLGALTILGAKPVPENAFGLGLDSEGKKIGVVFLGLGANLVPGQVIAYREGDR